MKKILMLIVPVVILGGIGCATSAMNRVPKPNAILGTSATVDGPTESSVRPISPDQVNSENAEEISQALQDELLRADRDNRPRSYANSKLKR
jgi:hypothetical protein